MFAGCYDNVCQERPDGIIDTRNLNVAWYRGQWTRTIQQLALKLAANSKRCDSGCIEWTGYKLSTGYGQTKFRGKFIKTHRAAMMIRLGSESAIDGFMVCHTCDNPSCINPDHMFLGSAADNMRDKTRKGRARGAKALGAHHNAKLSADNVREILNSGKESGELAKMFAVSSSLISKIRSGKRWSSLVVQA